MSQTKTIKPRIREFLGRHPKLDRLSYPFRGPGKFRKLTSFLRVLPDFVIIGAQKSGTTTLYDLVTKHPCVAAGMSKEPAHFSRHNTYVLGESRYRSRFPTKFCMWLVSIRNRRHTMATEASTAYLFYPAAPIRMKRMLPDARLIVILRNPVDRAYSHYQMCLRDDQETLTFEEAIGAEESRIAAQRDRIMLDPEDDYIGSDAYDHLQYHSYLARGTYAQQLEHWFRYYDRKQFLILTADEMAADTQDVLDKVFDFLGVGGGAPTD